MGLVLSGSFFLGGEWSDFCRVSAVGFSVEESDFSSLPTIRDGSKFGIGIRREFASAADTNQDTTVADPVAQIAKSACFERLFVV